MKFNIRRRFKFRYKPEAPETLLQLIRSNQAWSADFMSNPLMDGRCFSKFNGIDGCTWEAHHVAIGVSLNAE